MNVNLRSLIGKLNNPPRGALEGAAGLCLARTHYDVEIEHFLLKLLDASDADTAYILKHFEVNRSRLANDLTRSLDRLKSGNARTPALSPTLTRDRKSTRLNSSHLVISYAVFCLKKKKPPSTD